MLFVRKATAPSLGVSFLNVCPTRPQIDGMFTIDPPLYFLIRGRERLVEGDLAGIGSSEDLGDLVFDTDVDLQTAEDIGLMGRKIVQEGYCVQGFSPRLGIEDPVGQGVLVRSSHLRIVVDQIQNLLSQGFGHAAPPRWFLRGV